MEQSLYEVKNDAIIQHFMRTRLWAKIMAIPNLVFVYVGGSRFYGTTYLDTNSDYDIVAVTTDLTYLTPSVFAQIKGKSVHYSIIPLRAIGYTQQYFERFWALYAGMVKYNRLSWNNIIWFDAAKRNLIENLLAYKNQIQLVAFHKYVYFLDSAVCRQDHYNSFEELYHQPKAFYHIFAAYKDLTGKGDEAWIRAIKQKQIDGQEVANVVKFFDSIVTWCNDHPLNLAQEEKEIDGYLNI